MKKSEPAFTLGVEEEYLLVDKDTRSLVVDPPQSLMSECEQQAEGQVSSELLRSQIEVGTKVCANIQEVREDLARLRKIIVDTYGGWGRHGGGAFSGKDPTKVDRSAAYMARHVAKTVVAAGLAERCEVQLAYAIGVTEPVSVHIDTQGTGRVDDSRICEIVRSLFPLTPGGIIEYLDLRRPIYRLTAAGGHFGRSEPEFTWESTSRAAELAEAAGTAAVAR